MSGLLELAVEGLALIERLRVPLEPGFTVITGETGAGKSLLIDALGLVLGGRADPAAVRSGARLARVEALFERPGRDEPLICVREVAPAGRSLARIDDETVTAARLAATAGPLVAIHGQHQQQRLLEAAAQRDLLDAYGGHGLLREQVAAAVAAWRANRAALEAVADAADLERRIALAEHAAGEIEAARVQPGEVAELRAALARLASQEAIDRLVAGLSARLSDERLGARDVLAVAAREATELARLDPRRAALAERIGSLAAEVDDVAVELGRLDDTEADGPSTADLEARLGLLYGLLRKYGEDEAAVVAHGQAARAEAEELRQAEAQRAERLADDTRLEAVAREAAARLGAARREAGERLAAAAGAALADLGLAGARLSVDLQPAELTPTGADGVTFQLAANPGEPERPLAAIASGGELSRISLAIETVLAGADTTPTLVFDEVDAGIGARSADPVGRALRRLARDHQVIVVTHLAQIAAHAQHHLLIEKRVEEGRTLTTVRALAGEDRVHELALMLGGAGRGQPSAEARSGASAAASAVRPAKARPAGAPSAAALATARELLAGAEPAATA